jgi:hypothetical protein
MKTRALVAIEIDFDAPPQASSTDAHEGRNALTGEPATLFEVKIFPNDANGEAAKLTPESLKTSLAHELGHVVARIADTKANREDPRTKPQGNRFTDNPAKRNFESYADPSRKAEFDARLKSAILIEALIESLGKHDRSTVN